MGTTHIRTIGILGGSFNPPHLGHLQMAKEAYRRLNLDEVWMMVTPQNPHKTSDEIENFQLRFEQCQILTAEHPWLKVSDFEKVHNTKYTAETLKRLKERYPDINFVWIMGSENFVTFHKWQNWEYIIENFPIVTLYREDTNSTGLNSPVTTKYAQFRHKEKDALTKVPNWRIIFMPPHAGRATNIRAQLASGEKPLHLTANQLEDLKKRSETCKYFK